MSECKLRRANGISGVACDREECVYWRVVEHLDLEVPSEHGCAIQYFELLEGANGDLVTWLLSVKERMETEGS